MSKPHQPIGPDIDPLKVFAAQPVSAAVKVETYICLDCHWHRKEPEMSKRHEGYCVHYTPEYWEAQGWTRNWGDAAVMAWPTLEILRKQTANRVEFLVLCPQVRRPVQLYFDVHPSGWGSF